MWIEERRFQSTGSSKVPDVGQLRRRARRAGLPDAMTARAVALAADEQLASTGVANLHVAGIELTHVSDVGHEGGELRQGILPGRHCRIRNAGRNEHHQRLIRCGAWRGNPEVDSRHASAVLSVARGTRRPVESEPELDVGLGVGPDVFLGFGADGRATCRDGDQTAGDEQEFHGIFHTSSNHPANGITGPCPCRNRSTASSGMDDDAFVLDKDPVLPAKSPPTALAQFVMFIP